MPLSGRSNTSYLLSGVSPTPLKVRTSMSAARPSCGRLFAPVVKRDAGVLELVRHQQPVRIVDPDRRRVLENRRRASRRPSLRFPSPTRARRRVDVHDDERRVGVEAVVAGPFVPQMWSARRWSTRSSARRPKPARPPMRRPWCDRRSPSPSLRAGLASNPCAGGFAAGARRRAIAHSIASASAHTHVRSPMLSFRHSFRIHGAVVRRPGNARERPRSGPRVDP